VSGKTVVETAIANESASRFRLTEGTPLHNSYAKEIFGFLCENKNVNEILHGNEDFINSLRLSSLTKDFLRLFKKTNTISINTTISTKDFVQHWGKVNENTSSSYSSRHFGHYIAASHSKHLSEIHSMFVHIGFNSTAEILRWEKALSVMLEKEPGVLKVSKLRAILLLEADYNFGTKLIFAKRMMSSLEEQQKVPQEQFARKSHAAIEVALNRRLVSDISRQSRLPTAIMGADAAHCYDRIGHVFSILACLWAGIPLCSAQALFRPIQNMKVFIRTGYGDSDIFYGGDKEKPFQGSRQGNGAGPAIWLLVIVFLFRMMIKKDRTATFKAPMSRQTLNIAGLAYVDDTDLVSSGVGKTEKQIVTHLRKMARLWHSSLIVSGGSLRPEKCYWYFLRFTWKKGIPHLIKEQENYSMSLSRDQQAPEIKYLPPNKAQKVVGVFINPDGSSNEQF
jgi:hypothetical protein